MSKVEKLGSRELSKLPLEEHSSKGNAAAQEDRIAELESFVDKLIAASKQQPATEPPGEPPKVDRKVDSTPLTCPPAAVSQRKSRPNPSARADDSIRHASIFFLNTVVQAKCQAE